MGNVSGLLSDPSFISLSNKDKIIIFQREAVGDPAYNKLPQRDKEIIRGRISGEAAEMPAERTFLGEIGKAVPEIAAGTLASIKTAARRTPFAAGVTGIASAGGEAIRQIGEQVERGTGINVPLVSGEDAPRTGPEALMRILGAGSCGVFGETGGRAAIVGLKRLFPKRPFPIKKLTPEGQKAVTTASELPQIGPEEALGGRGGLLPAEVTPSWLVDVEQNLASKSIFGGGIVEKFKKARDISHVDIANDLVSSIDEVQGPKALGRLAVDIIDKKWTAYKNAVSKNFYNKAMSIIIPVERNVKSRVPFPPDVTHKFPFLRTISTKELQGGAFVNISSLKPIAKESARISANLRGIGSEKTGSGLAKQVLSMKDKVDLVSVRDLRTSLRTVMDEYDSVGNKKARFRVLAASLLKALDKPIEDSLKEFPEAARLWKKGDELWKGGNKLLNNEVLRKIIFKSDFDRGGKPEALVKELFTSENSSVTEMFQRAVGEKTWSKFQASFMNSLIHKATKPRASGGGTFVDGDSLFKQMLGPEGYGYDTMSSILSKAQLDKVEKITNLLQVAGRRQAEGIGGMFIQLKQPGAAFEIGGALLGGTGMVGVGASGAILLTPLALALMMTSKSGAKLLTHGLRAIPGTKQAASTVTRISLMANRLEREQVKGEEEGDIRITGERPLRNIPFIESLSRRGGRT
jgi:hypothetical protein